MRTIRRFSGYVCTRCAMIFQHSADAKRHAAEKHKGAETETEAKPRKRRGATQVQKVYDAVAAGATNAEEVAKRTRITVPRVHAVLAYLRRRGRIEGYTGELKAVE